MKLVLSLVVAALLSFATQSKACSYSIDELKLKNELAGHLLTSLNIGLDEMLFKVKKLEITDFSAIESIPTMMCPKEMTYSATVNIQYFDHGICYSSSRVTLVEGWGSDRYRNFKIDTVNGGPTCLLP